MSMTSETGNRISSIANEGYVEKAVEKAPTDLFLYAAAGSIGLSLMFKILGKHRDAEFVGHWAPTFLGLGLLSKIMQHDRHSHE